MSNTWLEFVSEIMSMLVYGFSLHEIVYKRREVWKLMTAHKGQDTMMEK